MPGLTPKQEAFAHRYVETGNASDAYRFAFDTSNMKVKKYERYSHGWVDWRGLYGSAGA